MIVPFVAFTLALFSVLLFGTGPTTAVPVAREWRIAACAVVTREDVGHIVEWVEFHRLQGVDRFVLYNDGTADNLEGLPDVYEAAGERSPVEVLPANVFKPADTYLPSANLTARAVVPEAKYDKRVRHLELDSEYSRLRTSLLLHCHHRVGTRAHWILGINPNEFLYASKNNRSVWDFLVDTQHDNVPAWRFPTARFGPSGWKEDLRIRVAHSFFTGGFDLLFDPSQVTKKGVEVKSAVTDKKSLEGYPLVMEANTKRSPSPELEGEAKLQQEFVNGTFEICVFSSKWITAGIDEDPDLRMIGWREDPCWIERSHTTLFRPHLCRPEDNGPFCRRNGISLWDLTQPEIPFHRLANGTDGLRVDHHPWISEDSLGRVHKWDKFRRVYSKKYNETALRPVSEWYALREDTTKADRFAEAVRSRIASLRPKPVPLPTLDPRVVGIVGHDKAATCDAEELRAGRAGMCPETHPYMFHKGGRECCMKNEECLQAHDKEGPPLTVNSTCCASLYRHCTVIAGNRWERGKAFWNEHLLDVPCCNYDQRLENDTIAYRFPWSAAFYIDLLHAPHMDLPLNREGPDKEDLVCTPK